MPRCARKGCGKDYDKDANAEDSCSYHPGDPVRMLAVFPHAFLDIRSPSAPRHSRFSTRVSNPGHVVIP